MGRFDVEGRMDVIIWKVMRLDAVKSMVWIGSHKQDPVRYMPEGCTSSKAKKAGLANGNLRLIVTPGSTVPPGLVWNLE